MKILLAAALGWCGLGRSAFAGPPEVARIFAEHMVLQRDVPTPVWGWADRGSEITVTFANQKITAITDAEGKWMVRLAPLKCTPDHQGQDLTVASAAGTATVRDILIGDVWISGGQSNMAFKLDRTPDGREVAAAAEDRLIRICDVVGKRSGPGDAPPRDLEAAEWKIASPATVADFSAVAYFFGESLRKSTGVPIGLIDTSVGGTSMRSWMSRETMLADSKLRGEVERAAEQANQYPRLMEQYHRQLASYQKRLADGNRPAHKPIQPKAPNSSYRLSYLHTSMIRPLQPLAIKGVIWYQGESDAGRHAIFEHQFSTLVAEWRREWGQGDFPWLYVQLAPYSDANGRLFPRVWEAQSNAQAIPNSAMVVALDHGVQNDIHPPVKRPVGERLALAARALAYQQDVTWRSPDFLSVEKQGAGLLVNFPLADGELVAKDGDLGFFTIAGADRKFLPANARLATSNTIIVSHPEIPTPVAVRYGWYDRGGPVGASLFTSDGLPVAPFRSDDWPDPK